LPFLGIVDTVERVVTDHEVRDKGVTLDDVLAADAWAREAARVLVAKA
jgi:1-deoxy-D-xylulose-5-phosphate reductoisomerase